MSNVRRLLLTCGILALLCACRGGRSAADVSEGDTLAWRYAERISIVRHDGYDVVTLRNPWKEGKVLHRYVLVPRHAELPDPLPEGTLVHTPLQRAAVFTTVHCALLTTLHREASIVAVADLKYIKIPWIQQQVAEGHIVDCGDGLSPMVEKIIDAQADAILLSPFENSGGYGRLEEIGIPLIECAEYMETSPLGRAEWMRFYGMLFGAEQQTDSLFAVVDSSYQALCREARTSSTRPTVLVDKQVGTVWYVPGGRSTIGQMLADAQCDYPFAADDHSGSLPLPFEAVLEKAGHADVWLFRYDADAPITMRQLLADQHGYAQLRPTRTGQVYGCNVRTSHFYEQSPFRPDLLLRDFITILHPDLPSHDTLRYYNKIE